MSRQENRHNFVKCAMLEDCELTESIHFQLALLCNASIDAIDALPYLVSTFWSALTASMRSDIVAALPYLILFLANTLMPAHIRVYQSVRNKYVYPSQSILHQSCQIRGLLLIHNPIP